MHAIIVTYVIRPGHEDEAAAHFAACIEPSRSEAGNLRYHAYRSHEDPRTFFLFEEYVDEQAFQMHRTTPHFELHIKNGIMNIMESRTFAVCTPLDQTCA
ncbi:MAG: putative quinol monooxygenase [Candidatus Baltobacteraceae bacterium]